jgi:metal-responsive CopG/Arc/MetJ family transcriptional regulator
MSPKLIDSRRIHTYIYVVTLDRKMYTFYLDSELAEGLKAVKERDGISESEQIRRAIRTALEAKNVTKKKTAPRRVVARRKA